MSAITIDAERNHGVVPLPPGPYPGLRPFLNYEAVLLLGRESQVQDVVDRLRQTQLVAVIGGSGSGKSSLVLAGVVPELRSFAIRGAGDFWLPIVCTPGTNVSQADVAGSHTPITRLAWKFAKLLEATDPPEKEAARLTDIAAVFRQPFGFQRLVEKYADQLSVDPVLAADKACLLFVLDQFEEIFHLTNKAVTDAGLMVERVIDHFNNPHPRCFVVLTMRSEHLNDCAGYLELPDAINASSYLVRRLNEQELGEAIVGPAQRYLRLLQRRDKHAPLPDAVEFEPRVVARLLGDVRTIADDPDHLPLLQHLLARLWESACTREGVTDGVPVHIVWSDLVRAVLADQVATDVPADKTFNALRASLENWAEGVFRGHAQDEQARIESMLRRLAFKDPKTGMYTQQRIDVDDRSLFGADVDSRKVLWSLVEDGFVGSVDYLFWDDDSPKRVTLKVSHESFIRGWLRFRNLIDKEAERFEEFVSLLRKCSSWLANHKPSEQLLEKSELGRVHDAKLEPVLANAAQRMWWFNALLQVPDGTRLAKYESDIDTFLVASKARQRAIARSVERSRWGRVAMVALLLLLVPWVLFLFFVQIPVTKRAQKFFDASSMAEQAQVWTAWPSFEEPAKPLKELTEAAKKVVEADQSIWLFALGHLSWLPIVQEQKRFLNSIANQAKPKVNGQLRTMLTSALWSGGAPAVATLLPGSGATEVECQIADPGRRAVKGRLFLRLDRLDTMPQPGIFIPSSTVTRSDDIVLLAASVDAATKRCVALERIYSVPKSHLPAIMFDALLDYLLVSTAGTGEYQGSVTLFEVDWTVTRDGKAWRAALSLPLTVLYSGDAVDRVRDHVGTDDVRSMQTWLTPGGRMFRVGDQNWRWVSTRALALDINPGDSDWVKLNTALESSTCSRLLRHLNKNSGSEFSRPMLEHEERWCFEIKDGPPTSAGQVAALGGSGLEAQRVEVVVAVYEKPSLSDFDEHGAIIAAPVASLRGFGRFDPAQNRWFVGAKDYEGWIALQHPNGDGEKYFGAPWSTSALIRLATDVGTDQPATPRVDAPSAAGNSSPR